MASCPLESHLEYHDVCVMDKSFSEFRALLIKEMRSDLYVGGHFQAIQPMGPNNSILMYLQNNVRIDPPEPSPSFPSILMSRHVPLSNLSTQISIINGAGNRNRFFSENEV